MRNELIALSGKWREWNQGVDKNYDEYRREAIELMRRRHLGAVERSGLLQKDAPIFFKQFMEQLDRKPRGA